MTHFGLICPSATGHLNTIIPIGQELKKRGHCVTLIGFLDSQAKTLAAGLEFQVIGETEFPLGKNQEIFTKLGELDGLKAVKFTLQMIADGALLYLKYAPNLIKKIGIEVLLVDQVSYSGATIAEYLNIPFVTICSALILNREATIPPFNTNNNYDPTLLGILRNFLGYKIIDQVGKPLVNIINSSRQEWGLSPLKSLKDSYSELAQISQQPAEFDFPRKKLPQCFYFTGPYHYSGNRETVSFPWEKLTGKPLIYASMGTLQNRLLWVFEIIAKAASEFDIQLVITLGGGTNPESLPTLPGNPIVVRFAPQLELLKKATLTITHAGLNTTLECLTNGVPMVAIPVTNDQPGVAARIAYTGTGEVIPLTKLSVEALKNALHKVLTDPSFKNNALRLQGAIQQAGGVNRAADIIEQVANSKKSVYSKVN
jgi:zeaxanthin glucosyltransferase